MQKQKDTTTVILAGVRTPFAKAAIPGSGKAPGRFADIHPVDMQVPLVNELLKRTGIAPEAIRKVLTGCVHQEGSQGLNIARLNVLSEKCGLTNATTGTSVDSFCSSSLEALQLADGLLARNPDSVYIVTGVQSMSQVPMGGSGPSMPDSVMDGNATAFMDMPSTAQNLKEMWKISDGDIAKFVADSHARLKNAQEEGHYQNEIVPLAGLDHDDGLREDTTEESLLELKKSKPGGYAAASSSQITDGASAVIVSTQAYADANNLPVLGRIVAFGEAGLAPEIMGIGPVGAIRDLFNKTGLGMDDIDLMEINEAFAPQSLAVLKELEDKGMGITKDKVNIDGGAIAAGHPLGASGLKIAIHLMESLKRENKHRGIATLCVGGGQGLAVLVENPDAAPKPGM